MLGDLLCFVALLVAICGQGARKIVARQFANFAIQISLVLMVKAEAS